MIFRCFLVNQKIFERVEEWRNRPLSSEFPYVFVGGIWLKRSWGGEVQNVSVLMAIGVGSDGYREVLGVVKGSREDSESWRNFFSYLRSRGLVDIKLVVSDKSLCLLEALGNFILSPDGSVAWFIFIGTYLRPLLVVR